VPMPNFFIIGAPKAGTSSLYEYVAQHPDVYMSPVKEPAYFKPRADVAESDGDGAPAGTGLDEYLALFDGATSEHVIGEATASYLQSVPAAERLSDAAPGARLVAVLRNPVDRAYSGYSMRVQQGSEDLTFVEAIDVELGRRPASPARRVGYLGPGWYGRHLSAYLARYPREQVRVYLYEDLRAPHDLLHDVFTFLDVDPAFHPTLEHHNVTRYPVKSTTVAAAVRRVPGKALARRFVPASTWASAKRALRRRNSVRPEFPPDLRRELIELYRDDIALTEELVGRDLSAWTSSGGRGG